MLELSSIEEETEPVSSSLPRLEVTESEEREEMDRDSLPSYISLAEVGRKYQSVCLSDN